MTASRDILLPWVFAGLKSKGGEASVYEIADYIWTNHSPAILANRKLLLTWQYEMRWAANQLRNRGFMKPNKSWEPWALTAAGHAASKP